MHAHRHYSLFSVFCILFLGACNGEDGVTEDVYGIREQDSKVQDPKLDTSEQGAVEDNTLNPVIDQARAYLQPTRGHNARGVVTFVKRTQSPLQITLSLSGMEAGYHGFHIHETGDCSSADAESIGGHYNPYGSDHGAPNSAEHHLGDLGNLLTLPNGRVDKTIDNRELALSGEYSIVQRAVIIHENADDFKTQPSGDSGERIACGVIKPVETESS